MSQFMKDRKTSANSGLPQGGLEYFVETFEIKITFVFRIGILVKNRPTASHQTLPPMLKRRQ